MESGSIHQLNLLVESSDWNSSRQKWVKTAWKPRYIVAAVDEQLEQHYGLVRHGGRLLWDSVTIKGSAARPATAGEQAYVW